MLLLCVDDGVRLVCKSTVSRFGVARVVLLLFFLGRALVCVNVNIHTAPVGVHIPYCLTVLRVAKQSRKFRFPLRCESLLLSTSPAINTIGRTAYSRVIVYRNSVQY